MNGVIEHIKISDFFSIKEFDWEIKDFNILTGGMATGKSLCLKLVYFFEQILRRNIASRFLSNDTLEKEVFYNNMTKRFFSLFHSVNHKKDFSLTKIQYTFKVPENGMVFDLKVEWNKNTDKLEWQSNYIDSHIDSWQKFFDRPLTPESARNARAHIAENIDNDFLGTFPVSIIPIPASRAIGSIANNIDTDDEFLNNFFNNYKTFVMDFNNVSDVNTNKILHLKDIKVKEDPDTKEKTFVFKSQGGREIRSLQLSSGQQELLYLLLLIKDLKEIEYSTETVSVFIEEPCAHLFPQEQKESIEYCAEVFRNLRDAGERNVRYFITSHSPYILNTINNMLKKGSLINRFKDKFDEIQKRINFPHIYIDEFSASFINKDGTITDILDREEEIMFPDKISEISSSINDDTNSLDELFTELS